jgi:hypothetical protein
MPEKRPFFYSQFFAVDTFLFTSLEKCGLNQALKVKGKRGGRVQRNARLRFLALLPHHPSRHEQ